MYEITTEVEKVLDTNRTLEKINIKFINRLDFG